MKKCIACVGALMILSSSAFGDWWDGLDWEEVSTTAAGNFSALYAQNSENWLYLRVDLDTEANPFDGGGFSWHFDANDGTGFDMFGWGTFYSDALLWSAGDFAGAAEQTAEVYQDANLLDGAAGSDYRFLMDASWYQPFNSATETLYYRVDRSQLYHNSIGDYLFASGDDPQTIQIGVLSGDDFISGSYTIPEPGTMSLLLIGLLGVLGLRRRLK